jgi:hypothetical protein
MAEKSATHNMHDINDLAVYVMQSIDSRRAAIGDVRNGASRGKPEWRFFVPCKGTR